MLVYVVRNNAGNNFFDYRSNSYMVSVTDATLMRSEESATQLAEYVRRTYPDAGAKVSCFRVEFSDV
jgi:hypothetical protein